MIEIKGKVNAAICYATVVEGEVPSRVMRKFVCRLWLNAVSQQ